MPFDALNTLRAEIDMLDACIAALLGQRVACTDKIGQLKSAHQLPAVDAAREAWQMGRLETLANTHGVNPVLLKQIFRLVVDEAVEKHKKLGAPHTE